MVEGPGGKESRTPLGNACYLNGALVQLMPVVSQPHLAFCTMSRRGKAECLKTTFPRLSYVLGPEGNPKAAERGVLLWL